MFGVEVVRAKIKPIFLACGVLGSLLVLIFGVSASLSVQIQAKNKKIRCIKQVCSLAHFAPH